jgi:uncharacterized protein GlcG (DUF336 family)
MLLADARRATAAAEKKAAEIGQPMNIAMADEGGNLVAHIWMDGAWIGSIDISIKKAYLLGLSILQRKTWRPTRSRMANFSAFHASNGGKIMIFAGGMPRL